MNKRPGVNKTLRSHTLRRDGQACRKCGRFESLDIHHIITVMDGGTDDPDNVITLCRPCHREWELAEQLLEIDFFDWLPMPPYDILLTSFMDQKNLDKKTKIKTLHDATMQTHQIRTNIRRMEGIDRYNEGKGSNHVGIIKNNTI